MYKIGIKEMFIYLNVGNKMYDLRTCWILSHMEL